MASVDAAVGAPINAPAGDVFVPRRCTSADRLMWLTPDRVFYAGLLGAPGVRTQGALTVYVAIEGRLRVRLDGGDWQTTDVAVVQPYQRYQIACEGRHVLNLLIEPETVDLAQLPPPLRACGAVHAPELAAQVRRRHQQLVSSGVAPDLQPSDFDLAFLGAPLPARSLDRRIADVLERIRANPAALVAAEQCAGQAKLSFSRFLHLFKEQVGAPFRNVRTWKRARSLLQHVHTPGSLVHVALDIGYPDSTHFSHSIRQAYGLKPKDIMAGSRKLRVIVHAPAPTALPAG